MTDRIIGQRAVEALLSGRNMKLDDITFPQSPRDYATRNAAIKTLSLNGWYVDEISAYMKMRRQAVIGVLEAKMPKYSRNVKEASND